MDRDTPATPRPGLVKTLGWLNISFGGLLLAGLCCMSTYLIALAAVVPVMEQQQKAAEANRAARRQVIVARVNAATEPEERKNARAELQRFDATPVPPMPDLSAATSWMKAPRVRTHYILDFASGALLNALLLIAGIGLVRRREWARKLSLGVAALKIVRLVALTVALFAGIAAAVGDSLKTNLERMQQGLAPPAGMAASPGMTAEDIEEASRGFAVMTEVSGSILLVVGSIYPLVLLIALTRRGARAACRPATAAPPVVDVG